MEGTAVVDGVGIGFRRVGSGRPVLLSGGTGMPPVAWETCGFEGAIVEAGFEVISYAARGVVGSDAPPAPYSIEEMADDAAGLLDHLDLDDVVVLGYSLGGFTVEALASRRPDRLKAAVLLAGTGPATALLRATVAMERELIAAVGHIPPATAAFQTLMTGLAPSLLAADDRQVAEWVDLLSHQSEVWTSRDGEVGQAAAADAWVRDDRRMERLREVRIPVLVAAFEHDPMFPPATCRVALDHLQAGQFVEIPGAGHAGVMTHPTETAAAVLDFLRG